MTDNYWASLSQISRWTYRRLQGNAKSERLSLLPDRGTFWRQMRTCIFARPLLSLDVRPPLHKAPRALCMAAADSGRRRQTEDVWPACLSAPAAGVQGPEVLRSTCVSVRKRLVRDGVSQRTQRALV